MTIQVLIPSYNCGKWIRRCMESVAEQDYEDYQVLIVDDASTDNQKATIRGFIHDRPNWRLHVNRKNVKCPANLVYGIDMMKPDPDDVIFLLDGDDFLPHSGVFSRIAEVYEDPDVWLTYGNYSPHPRNTGQTLASAYSFEEIVIRDFRTQILFNHPITFRYFLWKSLPHWLMQEEDGSWLEVGYDRAIMVPMLEMCSPRFRFLDENLYCYNAVNPLSDYHVRLAEAQRVHQYLAERPKMRRITDEEAEELRAECTA